jgi:hypothetical protein
MDNVEKKNKVKLPGYSYSVTFAFVKFYVLFFPGQPDLLFYLLKHAFLKINCHHTTTLPDHPGHIHCEESGTAAYFQNFRSFSYIGTEYLLRILQPSANFVIEAAG